MPIRLTDYEQPVVPLQPESPDPRVIQGVMGGLDGEGKRMLADELKGSLKADVNAIVNDEIQHARVLVDGQAEWRVLFGRKYGAFWGKSRAACDDVANSMYRMFQSVWERIHPKVTPQAFLDHVEIPSPPDPREFDQWTLESASDERLHRQMWQSSGRTRTGSWEDIQRDIKEPKR